MISTRKDIIIGIVLAGIVALFVAVLWEPVSDEEIEARHLEQTQHLPMNRD